MENEYEKIDMSVWNRREHCNIYKTAMQPQYCVTFELDVARFKRFTGRQNISFGFAFIYVVTKCANELEEFRYRFLDGEVVRYRSIDPSFTYLNPKTELFKVVRVPMQTSLEKFVKLAATTAENQKEYFTGPMENDVYQFSSLPWLSYTHVSHTNFGDAQKAQPIFNWGKYCEKQGNLSMPFSVQVHHSFVDGLHIGKLAENLQRTLQQME